MMITCVFKK